MLAFFYCFFFSYLASSSCLLSFFDTRRAFFVFQSLLSMTNSFSFVFPSNPLMSRSLKLVLLSRYGPGRTLVCWGYPEIVSSSLRLRRACRFSSAIFTFHYKVTWPTDTTAVPHASGHCVLFICAPLKSFEVHSTSGSYPLSLDFPPFIAFLFFVLALRLQASTVSFRYCVELS